MILIFSYISVRLRNCSINLFRAQTKLSLNNVVFEMPNNESPSSPLLTAESIGLNRVTINGVSRSNFLVESTRTTIINSEISDSTADTLVS